MEEGKTTLEQQKIKKANRIEFTSVFHERTAFGYKYKIKLFIGNTDFFSEDTFSKQEADDKIKELELHTILSIKEAKKKTDELFREDKPTEYIEVTDKNGKTTKVEIEL